jgi:hypothetical protein
MIATIQSYLTFSSLDNEWNSIPSWVLNPQDNGGKGRCDAIIRNGGIFGIAHFTSIRSRHVLSQDAIFHPDGFDAIQHLDLFVPDIVGRSFSRDHDRWFLLGERERQ